MSSCADTDECKGNGVVAEADDVAVTRDDDVKEFVALLQALGCRVAAFDMDNTLVGAHSRGNMTKARVQEDFVAHVSRDFVRVVPAMRAAGIQLAVATWADRVKYRRDRRRRTHLQGEDLVMTVLNATVPLEAPEFFLVCYHPSRHGAEGRLPCNQQKLRHVRLIAEHYNVAHSQVALFDDAPSNIELTSGFYAFLVTGDNGFELPEALRRMRKAVARRKRGVVPKDQAAAAAAAAAEAGAAVVVQTVPLCECGSGDTRDACDCGGEPILPSDAPSGDGETAGPEGGRERQPRPKNGVGSVVRPFKYMSRKAYGVCDVDVREFVELVSAAGFTVVAFDMDQTMVAAHSHASMRRDRLKPDYVDKVSLDFVRVVPVLRAAGIDLAVATHSDVLEHTSQTPPETHILGDELARAVVQATVAPHAADFCVVGYNPTCHGDEGTLASNQGKRYHVRTIARRFGVAESEVLLFDDDVSNVAEVDDGGFVALMVDETTGFRVSQATPQLRELVASGRKPAYVDSEDEAVDTATAAAGDDRARGGAPTAHATAADRDAAAAAAAPELES